MNRERHESLSLFDSITDDTLSGYRLERLEVFNWGTFDKHVWSLKLNGRNNLVTGDIGSGKTTLVDAVTTLLVPAQRVAYNRAAGASSRERNLRSYVLGHYKTERSDSGTAARPVGLRDHNSYSVILGVFRNRDFQQAVTLAQVFWINDALGQPARIFAAAERELSIAGEFAGFGADIGNLRKQLRKDGVDLFQTFPPYGAWFRRRFGIDNERAMELFHQTVSMKSVGNLTDFVRGHMLEPFNAEPQIKALIDHFDDLDRAYRAVLTAKRQVSLLEPLVADCSRHEELTENVEQLRGCRDALRHYFASLKLELIRERTDRLNAELERQGERVERFASSRDEQRREVDGIRRAIAENGGDRIDSLTAEISRLEQERNRRKEKAGRYRELAASLDEMAAATEPEFLDQRKRLLQMESDLTESADRLRNQLTEDTATARGLNEELGDLQRELMSLRARRSNVPERQVALRQRLCRALDIAEEHLPFAGELLQVREEERDWEGAAERVLRNFGLALLVEGGHYAKVAAWVDANDLNSRLVYFLVRQRERREYPNLHPDSLVRKLSVKPDSGFYPWLETELARRFDIACCRDQEQFRREQRALTRSGQFKQRGERHEKDDRHRLDDRSRYVLGWSNEAKIAALEQDRKRRRTALDQLTSRIDTTNREHSGVEAQRRSLGMLQSEYTRFDELDWGETATRIQRLTDERDRLASASDVLRQLKEQLDRAEIALRKAEEQLQNASADRAKTEQRHTDAQQLFAHTEAELREAAAPTESHAQALPAIRDEALGEHRLSVESCDNRQQDVREWLQKRMDADEKKAGRLREKIVKAMSEFREEYRQETAEFDASIAAGPEYTAMLERLKADDLPRFEAHFKQLLNENTIREIARFQSQLGRHREEIHDRIGRINHSLAQIDYNPGRYIELEPKPAPDTEIREFRGDLRACTEGTLTGSDDVQYSESKFQQVKAIIDRLRGREGLAEQDRRWAEKVTDVRNWFVFSASERWREDNVEFEHYTDSGGKSGGQKEKLAYTVLAASLAYQFGLERDQVRSRSFRFVAIDEAFGRGSDESTQYALQLFNALHLQLLIITPLQKIHVIEPFVSGVGFVHNEDGRASRLRNLTIEEYREEREKSNGAERLRART